MVASGWFLPLAVESVLKIFSERKEVVDMLVRVRSLVNSVVKKSAGYVNNRVRLAKQHSTDVQRRIRRPIKIK